MGAEVTSIPCAMKSSPVPVFPSDKCYFRRVSTSCVQAGGTLWVVCMAVAVLALAIGGLLLLSPTASADELVVIEDGASLAPIVVFEGAPLRTRGAADELAEYLERMTGVRPEVIEGTPDPLPDHAIWVGYQPVMDELFPGVEFDFEHPEEILITANGRHLAVVGRDRWDPDALTVAGRRGSVVEGRQLEYGTINAVYTLLQDFLGVRWLWPGELGIEVPETNRVAFEPFEFRYHPQMRVRGSLFAYSQLGARSPYGRSQDWLKFQRLLLDSLEMEGGHPFSDWWGRFGETHPEYFALQPNGNRGGGNPRTVKICKSNPAVWDQWLADVETQLEADPNKRVFSAAANDGWSSGYCVCDNCRAWDHPDGELRRFSWAGLSLDYPAMSERQTILANTLARLLKERYPDRDYYVQMMAYGHSRPAPVEARPDDNVIVSSVANFLFRPDETDRGSPAGTTHKDQYLAWGQLTNNLLWRPNIGSPYGWRAALPGASWRQAAEDFRFAADNGCSGVFADMVWEHWAAHGPTYYMMGQMTWNPYLDPEAVMTDYFDRGFGPAARSIEAYWDLVEASGGIRSVEEQAEARALLERAAAEVANSPERFRKRVEFVRLGFDYTVLLTENQRLIERIRSSADGAPEARTQALANWEKVEALMNDEEFTYAISHGPVRLQTGRVNAYHPDTAGAR